MSKLATVTARRDTHRDRHHLRHDLHRYLKTTVRPPFRNTRCSTA
jgi:hypothetical protein